MFDDGYDPEPGAGGPLVGTIYPLLIWVSTPSDPWPAARKAEVRRAASVARDWLRTEAARHDVDLSFLEVGEFGATQDVFVPEIPLACGSGEELTSWMPDILSRLGWESPGQFFSRIQISTKCDGMHAMVMVHGAGRSYAVSAPGDPDAGSVVPVAACYLGRDGSISAQTIAHEILHLHGAWDLYEDEPHRGQMHRASQLHFPRDIMFRVDDKIDTLEIGPLTRWKIGWDAKAAGWYDFFRPRSRTATETHWGASEVPPSQRGPASGSTSAASRLSPERPVPQPACPPLPPVPRPVAPIKLLPATAPVAPSVSAPWGARRRDADPADPTSFLIAQRAAHREALERARGAVRAHGVLPCQRMLEVGIDPPRSPRPRASSWSRLVPLPARSAWAAYDELMVDRESLRRSIAAIGGAGRPLELKLQLTFRDWGRAIDHAASLLNSGWGGHQLVDCVDLVKSYRSRVLDQLEILERRAAHPANVAIVQAAHRFRKSYARYRRVSGVAPPAPPT